MLMAAPNIQLCASPVPTGIEAISAPNGGYTRVPPGQRTLRSVKRHARCPVGGTSGRVARALAPGCSSCESDVS